MQPMYMYPLPIYMYIVWLLYAGLPPILLLLSLATKVGIRNLDASLHTEYIQYITQPLC